LASLTLTLTLIDFIEKIENPIIFVETLLDNVLTTSDPAYVRLSCAILKVHSNCGLREEFQSYFSLPIFANISDTRLSMEIELFEDHRLSIAVDSIKTGSDIAIQKKASFFWKFLANIFSSTDNCLLLEYMQFINLLLLQPSLRRFIKPALEDVLFIARMKSKCLDMAVISELEYIFFYPINEITGVYFESEEEFVKNHFMKLNSYKKSLIEIHDLDAISNVSEDFILTPGKLSMLLSQFSHEQLRIILSAMGCANFPETLEKHFLIESISLEFCLRSHYFKKYISSFPDEVSTYTCSFKLFIMFLEMS